MGRIKKDAATLLVAAICREKLWATPEETEEWLKTETGQEIAEMFSARGLSFTTGTAVVVGVDEIRREEAEAMYQRKNRFLAYKLIGPATAASLLFMGLSFGWVTAAFFRVLVMGCVAWAAATV